MIAYAEYVQRKFTKSITSSSSFPYLDWLNVLSRAHMQNETEK